MKTPWSEMLRASVAMGIPPVAFWRLSLREWRMLTNVARRHSAMGRDDFQRLAEAWPDE